MYPPPTQVAAKEERREELKKEIRDYPNTGDWKNYRSCTGHRENAYEKAYVSASQHYFFFGVISFGFFSSGPYSDDQNQQVE